MSEINNSGTEQPLKTIDENWVVELDTEKCTLCEACSRKCPTAALRMVRNDGIQALFFKQSECIGCTGETSCVVICPEKAISLYKLESGESKDEEVKLIECEMIRCAYCHEYFTPDIKIESIEKMGLGHDVEKTYCPICRRTNLVVKFIEKKMGPGTHAEYRSQTDIIRRAKFRLSQEQEEEKEKEKF